MSPTKRTPEPVATQNDHGAPAIARRATAAHSLAEYFASRVKWPVTLEGSPVADAVIWETESDFIVIGSKSDPRPGSVYLIPLRSILCITETTETNAGTIHLLRSPL